MSEFLYLCKAVALQKNQQQMETKLEAINIEKDSTNLLGISSFSLSKDDLKREWNE